MGPFAVGQVVLIAFPFSDLSRSKLRPALVLAAVGRDDWLLAQITSSPYDDLCQAYREVPRPQANASAAFDRSGAKSADSRHVFYARPIDPASISMVAPADHSAVWFDLINT